jgi:hypothetical protein
MKLNIRWMSIFRPAKISNGTPLGVYLQFRSLNLQRFNLLNIENRVLNM